MSASKIPQKWISKLKNHHWIIALAILAVGITSVFMLAGFAENEIGFPLDDAWIHQTYARNLMQQGSWSFLPGEVSGGSTSPLWTLLLSLGFLLKGDFFFYWTLVISGLLLSGLILLLCLTLRNLQKSISPRLLVLFGLIAALEWHLQWAAASGMETILFSCVIVLLMFLASRVKSNWWLIGLAAGMLVWIRPDGLTLLGPISFLFLMLILQKKIHWEEVGKFLLGFLLLVVAYLIFNHLTTGQVFPNTFYAKQMEYSELLAQPLGQRIWNEFSPIWVGVCIILIPGFFFSFARSIVKKDLRLLGFMLWAMGYVVLFALRLPVIYQHGRYVMPVIPIFLLFGFMGTVRLLELIKTHRIKKMADFTVYGLMIVLSAAFFIRGIGTLRTDLDVIDTLMVQPARWIEENTTRTDIIAVHDIGAMGFFTDRKLLDLAGLINPEVIPFIRDETKIEIYMHQREAAYFVGFSDWYSGSTDWGQTVKRFNVNVDEISKEVDIIKLND